MNRAEPADTTSLAVRSRRGTPTWELADLFYPRQGDWTEEEYLSLGTNCMIEFTDGCLEFLPMPMPFHQFIVEFLFDAMRAYLKQAGNSGRVVQAPLPVRLREGKYREPDLVYLRLERIKDVHRPPVGADLALEVVSAGEEARERDLEIKREEYAKAGISEYWIVDAEERRISVLVLEGQEYRVHGEFGPGQTATSVLLPGFSVAVDETFAAGESLQKPE